MKVEKKFKVATLDPYIQKLEGLGIKPFKDGVSIHYYARNTGSTIRKIVEDEDEVRITELEDHGGTFEFTKRERVESLEAGLAWMKKQGHNDMQQVKMASKQYEYQDGKIELISINDGQIYSVILNYEPPLHEKIAKEIDLVDAEKIEVPFSELV